MAPASVIIPGPVNDLPGHFTTGYPVCGGSGIPGVRGVRVLEGGGPGFRVCGDVRISGEGSDPGCAGIVRIPGAWEPGGLWSLRERVRPPRPPASRALPGR
ncbi:hypothetical protein GCM10010517_60340 [Streptosporangium fragile]|uniref:Uncharacterized protein n=1 Tax=Streptosporangium fragile TaxID=46186 RepID=A0ABN3W6S9_9ACTN